MVPTGNPYARPLPSIGSVQSLGSSSANGGGSTPSIGTGSDIATISPPNAASNNMISYDTMSPASAATNPVTASTGSLILTKKLDTRLNIL